MNWKHGLFKLWVVVSAVLGLQLASPAHAGEAAEAIIDAFGIETHYVSRIDNDLYEIRSKDLIVVTLYCYAYATTETAVITETKIIFVDEDEACDVKGIYRR